MALGQALTSEGTEGTFMYAVSIPPFRSGENYSGRRNVLKHWIVVSTSN